jgi:hypothetical protein
MLQLYAEKRGRTIDGLNTGYIIRKVKFWKCSILLNINKVLCLWIALKLPAWCSDKSVGRNDLMILASGVESHCGTYVCAGLSDETV